MISFNTLSFEERMRLVVEQVPARALVTLDTLGLIVDWSFGAQTMFGWLPEEVIGEPFSMLFTPEDILANVPAMELHKARENGQASDVRWHIRKDGTRFFVDGEVTALKLADGAIAGYAKTLHEATDTLQLRKSEATFRAMVNATPHMVWSALPNGEGDYFNDRMVAFTGTPAASLRRHAWGDLVHAEDKERTWAAWQHAIHSGEHLSVEFRFRHHSGAYRWVLCLAAPVHDDEKRIVRWVGTNTDIHDERTAQAVIARSEERFRSLASATSQIVWETESDGSSLRESPTWCAFTGQTYEQAHGMGWLDAVHPDDLPSIAKKWKEAVSQGKPYEIEQRIRNADGQYRWVQVRAAPVLETDGSIREWIGTISDVTEKRETEAALQEARARLEATLAAGEVGTWAWNIPDNRVIADPNMIALYGIDQPEAAGLPMERFLDAVHPDDVGRLREHISESINSHAPFQDIYRVCLQANHCRYIHARGKVEYAADGRPLWLSGTALDITSMKEKETELRQQKERYQALFNSIDEGFCIIEVMFENGLAADYRFLETNPAFERLTGLRDVEGRTLRQLFSAPQRHWVEVYGEVVRTGRQARFTDYTPNLGRWFDISISRLGDDGSHQAALLFEDITDRRKNEEELRRLADDLVHANRRQNEFLATLAHELRNPLAPLRTGLDLINAGLEVSPSAAKVYQMMDRQVDHLVHLVDDLLDLARINSGKIELKKTRQVLQDIARQALEVSQPAIGAKQHELVADLPEEAIWLNADAGRLAQVISNLLTNAAKYTPDGGTIRLTVSRHDGQALIAVSDNGIGIAEEDVPRLFDMFSQIKRGMEYAQGGLGIGLNLVKRLVEKHGGTVTVSSGGPGCGSTFTISLPVEQRDTDAAVDNPRDERQGAPASSLNIVVADDNRDAASLLKELLEVNGHTVHLAHDGAEAVEVIRRHAPELALLDIGMPVIDGYGVARMIRSDPALKDMVLAAVTGWGAQDDLARSREAGFNHHLTKPVRIGVLLEWISQLQVTSSQ
jgi:PAS domain S-box-containing protein